MTKPDPEYVRRLVRDALDEDGAGADRTVDYLALGRREVTAMVVARDTGVVAGIDVAGVVFTESDDAIEYRPRKRDGDRVEDGEVVVELSGPAAPILSAERTALNFLQRLSGIATLTRRFVDAVSGTGVTILDTRKTTPLLRGLEKYAVRVGGGENHRFNLSDMILIKENHRRAIGGVEALGKALAAKRLLPAEVEVDSLELLHKILGLPVDRIMLDNFTPRDVRRAVAEIAAHRQKDAAFSPSIEVSGGVTLRNIRSYAVDGVDYISVGALTHSAPSMDISLEVAHGQ